ncbi:MAG: PadR family transcriptional regulator [Methanothrix sp.]|nr:PadR family transcriptional regulator [Methanothrix sp.]
MKMSVENVADLCESQEDYCKKFVDRIIKSNREVFIMYSLLEKQMCGYDLIKEIFSRCDVFLSQGTVYPILYTLEEEGLLHAEYSKGDMRSKKYSLTAKGRDIAEKYVEDFAKTLEQISFLVKR